MKTLPLTLFSFTLLGLGVTLNKGHVGGSLERCTCNGRLQERIRQQAIQIVRILPPSISCSELEILVTTKENKKVCLNPKGRQGKRILKFHSEKAQGKTRKPKSKKRQNRKKQT